MDAGKNKTGRLALSLLCVSVALLAGCSSDEVHKSDGGGNLNSIDGSSAGTGTSASQQSVGNPTTNQVDFPDPKHASPKDGTFPNIENMRQLTPGMTKQQLYALLGTPHFDEGLWFVHEWNYLFNFHRAPGSQDYYSCQFMVVFDDNYKASNYYWKPESCAAAINPAPEPAPAVVAAPAPRALPDEPLRLDADALFDFDSAVLTARGRQSVGGLLKQINSASQVEDIKVVGYTDRLGSDSYNLALSRRRADAVRDFLVAGGVSASAIHTEGRGKADGLVDCHESGHAALIECLAPNRRVEISGLARK